ncbi:MAG TPA: hypothetical protein ENN09_03805 [Planctomycetes bacterium]|nr:hypothetical protein [Planctomycetota bacterium]
MLPRNRLLDTLAGKPVRPIPWVEHGISVDVVEKAYGVKLPAVTGDAASLDTHIQAIRRQKRVNELTGCCNVELPRYYTMAPRVYKEDSHNGALTDEASFEKLVFVKLTSEHLDNLKRCVDEKGDYALSASISTGIGHVWQTMDLMAFSVAAVENPGLLGKLLARYTEWTCAAVERCNDAGIDFFWSFDDFAFKTGTVYSPQLLREVVLPHARAVAAAIKLPWIFHSDGNFMSVLDDIVSLGMTGLNPLEPGCMDIREIMRRHPRLALVGNIDVDLLARGTPLQVRGAVDACFREMSGARFVPSSSNSIPHYALPENVRAMFERIREMAE